MSSTCGTLTYDIDIQRGDSVLDIGCVLYYVIAVVLNCFVLYCELLNRLLIHMNMITMCCNLTL